MRELRMSGSVRGVPSNGHPYRDPQLPGDWLVFGSESAGLSASVRQDIPAAQTVRLPMRPGQRS